jgi:hypothetical protein
VTKSNEVPHLRILAEGEQQSSAAGIQPLDCGEQWRQAAEEHHSIFVNSATQRTFTCFPSLHRCL